MTRQALEALGLTVRACTPPVHVKDNFPFAQTLWLGFYPHTPYPASFPIASHYPGYQAVYLGMKHLIQSLREKGIQAASGSALPLKPLARELGAGWIGKQSLLHHPEFGSYCSIHVLLTDERIPPDASAEAAEAPCGDCTLCQQACPTHAVREYGICRERCLRQWMLSGQIAPREIWAAMGQKLLGCDLCQRACPHNPKKQVDPEEALIRAVHPEFILSDPSRAARTLAPLLGENMARPTRLLQQALLMAGNKKDQKLLPLILPFLQSKNECVAEYAHWAMEQING